MDTYVLLAVKEASMDIALGRDQDTAIRIAAEENCVRVVDIIDVMEVAKQTSMTAEEALERLGRISVRGANDCENAHKEESKFLHDILQVIANGAPNAQELAQIALKSDDLEFDRYFA